MPRRIFGRLMTVTGILLILGSLGLTVYNVLDSNRAGEASEAVRGELVLAIEEAVRETETAPANAELEEEREEQAVTGELPIREIPTMDSYTVMVDGYPYIGILDIPDMGLSLPVMADWDYERLKISPCRYTGSPYTDDFVVCGHNYARHFSPLKWADIGKDVYFTTSAGERFHYIISNRETVRPEAVEEMVQNDQNSDSAQDWDMTLFTCNTGGQTRCAVRCVRQSE